MRPEVTFVLVALPPHLYPSLDIPLGQAGLKAVTSSIKDSGSLLAWNQPCPAASDFGPPPERLRALVQG